MNEILLQIEMMLWEILQTSSEQWPVDLVHVADVGDPDAQCMVQYIYWYLHLPPKNTQM